jgi:hypothetical protein
MDFRRSLAYWVALVATYLCIALETGALVVGGFMISTGVGLIAVAVAGYFIAQGLTGVTQYLLQRDYQRHAIAEQMERFRMAGEAAAGATEHYSDSYAGQYDPRRV